MPHKTCICHASGERHQAVELENRSQNSDKKEEEINKRILSYIHRYLTDVLLNKKELKEDKASFYIIIFYILYIYYFY